MNEKSIILQFPIQWVDYIAKVLAKRPYEEVKDILDLIVRQANDPQIQGMVPAPKPDSDSFPPIEEQPNG